MAITRDQVSEAARTVAAEGKEPTYVPLRRSRHRLVHDHPEVP